MTEPTATTPQETSADQSDDGTWHTVEQGECLESIAFAAKHFWETLWSHANNRELRKARGTPNVLMPGDQVFIPALRPKTIPCSTGALHRFVRKGVPSKLSLTLEDEHKAPLANQPYRLEIGELVLRGTTDAKGHLEQPIPPSARSGRLYVGAKSKRVFDLALGGMDPITEISGIQSRLNNLGFACGSVTGEL